MNLNSRAAEASSPASPALCGLESRRVLRAWLPWIWSVMASAIFLLPFAQAQQNGQDQQSQQPLNNGNDFTRPLTRFDFRYNFQEKGDGISQNQFILRLEQPFQIADTWKIATRFDMPFVLSNNTSSDNPMVRQFTLYDFKLEARFSHSF